MESKEGKTCAERIDEHLKGRLEQMFPEPENWSILECARHLRKQHVKIPSADVNELREKVFETARKQAIESVLTVEKTVTFSVCLSWGGPADYFELDWSPESNSWTGGRYVFEDWYDGASRNISREQTEELAQLFKPKLVESKSR